MADASPAEIKRQIADRDARWREHKRYVQALSSEVNRWWVRAGRSDLSDQERRQASEKAWTLGIQLARLNAGKHDPRAPGQQC